MKGKLIKEADFYGLKIDDKIVGLSDDITNNILNYPHKLSIKNCEAIERGYDLDELADEFAKTKSSHSTFQNTHKRDFREGFQKALEIIGDKKFNQNDVLDVVNHILHEMVLFEGFDKQYLFPESVYHEVTTKCQSIQPKEWEVEIVMEKVKYTKFIKNKDFCAYKEVPKLDSEGCLILKRI